MDLSQQDVGVSLLNDGKYGCDVFERTMRLTLLKAPMHPDPTADREVHHFSYALMPHAGDWRAGRTRHRAASLNQPALCRAVAADVARTLDGRRAFDLGADNLSLEAVKRSDDGEDLVVRIVERHNARTRVALATALPVKQAWRCDLMEQKEAEVPVTEGGLELDIAPCEIVTLRLQVRS